jgi:tRNA-splicing endonuclease subunit Sen54
MNDKRPQMSRPVIPKRGEKDFEPTIQGGSGLQMHFLDRARAAMLDALRATRTTSRWAAILCEISGVKIEHYLLYSKSISQGIWMPSIARVHVTTVRGIHFSSMGHSVHRVEDEEPSSEAVIAKAHKRLELLPEEAIYLIERGAMFCWKEVPSSFKCHLDESVTEGAPMTVQQAYSEMIGTVDLTLERYQASIIYLLTAFVSCSSCVSRPLHT